MIARNRKISDAQVIRGLASNGDFLLNEPKNGSLQGTRNGADHRNHALLPPADAVSITGWKLEWQFEAYVSTFYSVDT